MIYFLIMVGLFLGIELGSNNFSNLFGTAVGTKMIRIRTAVWLAMFSIFLGAFISGTETTDSVLKLAHLETIQDALTVSLSTAIIIFLSSKLAIPASNVQAMIGSLVGWNLYHGLENNAFMLTGMISAWLLGPILSCSITFLLIRCVRLMLRKYPLPLVTRDTLIRWGLIFMGMFASYAFGANNIGTITGPYLLTLQVQDTMIIYIACLCVGIGCLIANPKVIETVGRSLFQLSPTEALVVMMGSSLTTFLFTSSNLRTFLLALDLPTFPLAPIPMSAVIIGAITGISFAKGGWGLQWKVLGRIISSWILIPFLSAIFSYVFLWGIMRL